MAFKSYYKLVKYKDLNKVPFYVEDVSGQGCKVYVHKSNANASTLTIETSLDSQNWSTLGQTSTNSLLIDVPANGKVYVRCNTTSWSDNGRYNNFNGATRNFKVGGNIMSLLYGSNFTGSETSFPSGSTNTFQNLFSANYYIQDASELILPATTLVGSCYAFMFRTCPTLTAPPATLPATTLANNCYDSMFNGCTSLTAAPELPATTLTQNCYYGMFYNCTNLNSVTCLATNISASNCTYAWLGNVSSTGTFTKAASMSSWTTGVDGIPSGWTVQDTQ